MPNAVKPAASPMVRRNVPAGEAQLEECLLLIVARAPFSRENTIGNRREQLS